MNDGQMHQISAEIGSLKASVEMMTDLWKRQEENATAGRRSLHEKFEMFRQEVGNQIAGLSLRVDRLVDTMKDVEPAVQSFKDEKLRDEGAKRLGKALIAAMTAVAGAVGYGLHELIMYLKH